MQVVLSIMLSAQVLNQAYVVSVNYLFVDKANLVIFVLQLSSLAKSLIETDLNHVGHRHYAALIHNHAAESRRHLEIHHFPLLGRPCPIINRLIFTERLSSL